MEITGKVIQTLPDQSGVSANTGKAWKVAQFVIETQEQYPRKVCIEIFGEDRIKNNPVSLDQTVTVSFDLESREFNGRWYTSVRAWKVQAGDGQAPADPVIEAAAQQATDSLPQVEKFDPNAGLGESTELPF